MIIRVYNSTIPELGIALDTHQWFEWLESIDQFKYIGNLTEMMVKRRRANNKWYARKKIYSSNGGSKAVDLYLGHNQDVTKDKLSEVNRNFAKEWSDFWVWYYSPERKRGTGKGVQTPEGYTINRSVEHLQKEVEGLKSEIAHLRAERMGLEQLHENEMESIREECSNLLQIIKETNARHNELVARMQVEYNLLFNELEDSKQTLREKSANTSLMNIEGHWRNPP
jgi:flagellar motility protein MotE (MotC chaperone)